MNKSALVKKIIIQLRSELELYAKAARAAHAEATHEQSRAENKYDTRGLEASYLARGQSRQAAEIAEAIREFETSRPRRFSPNDPIDTGAVVELQTGTERTWYFIATRAGGTEMIHERKEILVITPESPLGQQLISRHVGDRIDLHIPGSSVAYRVVAIW